MVSILMFSSRNPGRGCATSRLRGAGFSARCTQSLVTMHYTVTALMCMRTQLKYAMNVYALTTSRHDWAHGQTVLEPMKLPPHRILRFGANILHS